MGLKSFFLRIFKKSNHTASSNIPAIPVQTIGPRKPTFGINIKNELLTTARVFKEQMLRKVEELLAQRDHTGNYLPGDRDIFQPYVDFSLVTLDNVSLYSYVIQSAWDVKELITAYEDEHNVKINKTDLYFSLAMNSVLINSTINASIYWELSQQEESMAGGITHNSITAIQDILNRFTVVTNAIELGLETNNFYCDLKSRYSWLGTFSTNIVQMDNPAGFSYFASSIRNRAGSGWLDTVGIDLPKMYGQELINALSILVEALLKLRPNLTSFSNRQFANILNGLSLQNPGVAAIIGNNNVNPNTGLFLNYPSGSITDFNANFPLLIAKIKSGTLNDEELKAYLIWGTYMLRNKGLHNYDANLVYYNNPTLFHDAIGLNFASVSAVLQL
ncbi:MAG: hypothetical protein ABI113_13985 [Mucilaginibacter sp.]